MSGQPGLAERVSALRRRIESLAPTTAAVSEPSPSMQRLREVNQRLVHLRRPDSHAAEARTAPEPTLPEQLTWRARRVLLHGREVVEQLKQLAADANTAIHDDPLGGLYEQALALAHTVLRSVMAMPESAAEQQNLCVGLETVLEVAGERVRALQSAIESRRLEQDRVTKLADLSLALVRGRTPGLNALQDLAESVAHEAQDARPLRLISFDRQLPESCVASHCLNVAQVLARITQQDTEWRGRQADVVLCALVFDAGMAALPVEILTKAGPLDENQRRQVEAHVNIGAEGVQRMAPAEGWLVEAVRAHHERLDGTGYGSGAHGQNVPRLARLLAVADVYTALASPRPYRSALTPRAALTETLLEAEKGRLDLGLAESLLQLSFYPVGTLVELADGRVGMVVATNPLRADLNATARPVVQLLTGDDGQPLPRPEHLNLAQCEGTHIVRCLSVAEGRELLGPRYWQMVA